MTVMTILLHNCCDTTTVITFYLPQWMIDNYFFAEFMRVSQRFLLPPLGTGYYHLRSVDNEPVTRHASPNHIRCSSDRLDNTTYVS